MTGISNININSDIFFNAINNKTTYKVKGNEKPDKQFEDVIKNAIGKVNDSIINSNEKIEALIKGEDVSMHDVMLSAQESQMSVQLMIEIRNKLYDAYQEINRVQL